jgi:hypothetical protein
MEGATEMSKAAIFPALSLCTFVHMCCTCWNSAVWLHALDFSFALTVLHGMHFGKASFFQSVGPGVSVLPPAPKHTCLFCFNLLNKGVLWYLGPKPTMQAALWCVLGHLCWLPGVVPGSYLGTGNPEAGREPHKDTERTLFILGASGNCGRSDFLNSSSLVSAHHTSSLGRTDQEGSLGSSFPLPQGDKTHLWGQECD